jgi:hypothetical protein
MQLVILFNLVCWSLTRVKSKLPGEAKQNNLPPECGQSNITLREREHERID